LVLIKKTVEKEGEKMNSRREETCGEATRLDKFLHWPDQDCRGIWGKKSRREQKCVEDARRGSEKKKWSEKKGGSCSPGHEKKEKNKLMIFLNGPVYQVRNQSVGGKGNPDQFYHERERKGNRKMEGGI